MFHDTLSFKQAKQVTLEQFERSYLLELIARFPSSLSAMSKASGLSRKHLRQLLRKHALRDQVSVRRGRPRRAPIQVTSEPAAA